ncbi:MAG: sterol desaturase family protein [Nannocystales bacterium]
MTLPPESRILWVEWALYANVVVGSVLGGIAVLWVVGGYYHLRYYVRRRHEPETWKLQPGRMPTAKQQRRAMVLSTTNLAIGGLLTGNLIFFVMTGALKTPVYDDVSDYGWIWTLASVPVLFFLIDGIAYYVHRFLHIRPMYRRFHRVHHRWGAPTPWVVIAVHPVEFLILQAATFVPLFVLPFHFMVVIAVLVYVLAFNIVDHSGVRLTSVWPWQGPSAYHDDHHVHFHVNFGQHLTFFDRIHGTLRRHKRSYGADTFGGKGAPTSLAVDGESAPEFVEYR